MPESPERQIQAAYNGDSLYKVEFRRMGRGSLRLTAAPTALREISDVVLVPLDEQGNPRSPEATATIRDGVPIPAEGREDEQ